MTKKKIGRAEKAKPRHAALQEQLARKNILIVGDVMLNERLEGVVERMSPENPMTPVVRLTQRSFTLGGAAGAAECLAALGAKPYLAGVVSNDRAGQMIRHLCAERGIADCLIQATDRPTTVKSRVFHNGSHLVRVDEESTRSLSPADTRLLLEIIRQIADDIHFVVISDYGKGVLTPELFRGLKKTFGGHRIVADLKPKQAKFVRGIRAIKPNRKEAEEISGRKIGSPQGAIRVAQVLADRLNSSILLTLGGDGMVAHELTDDCASHVPAEPVRMIDVTAAGDAVLSAAAAALVLGYDLHQAARFANRAAAVAVSKPDVATVTLKEIYDRPKVARARRAKKEKRPAREG
ncbi:MAG: bifunctional hydroxymethylpyrimidine kinase/phosphomethylpyrimidine kinase [Candidatus Liptonbacteria bacterium]|nr:bifunctional hydroxymethylpyrimidine kinase/phosphomethylpyrimidine kinase [Candidatus Liptonbacteria bacterium]